MGVEILGAAAKTAAPKKKWFQVTRFPALLTTGMHPY